MPYPKAVMNSAFDELGRRRNHSRSLYEYRRQEIAAKLPEVARIEKEMTQVSVALSKAILSGVGVAEKVERLRSGNLAMQARQRELLTQAGYPADYLEPQYQCDLCQDTGYTEEGMCSCMEAILKNLIYQRLGETSNIGECTFENFRLDYYPTTPLPGLAASARTVMTQAYERCKEYAVNFGPHSPSLFFQGATGLGKTHLSLAIASAAIEKGYDVLYIPTQGLMNRLEKERFSKENEDSNYMEFVLSCDLLVLDDLGAEFSTQFSVSALYNILNARLIEKKPTIISSNLDFKAIESRYSQRIVSRLVGSCITIPFMGNDIRTLRRPGSGLVN